MIRNYLKIAWRNLLKRKAYSLINIAGLATGMTVCLLIVLFIQDELSYDNFHEKGDHIYRVALERKYPGRSTAYSIIPPSIGTAIKQEFPEVQESTRLFNFTGNNNFLLRIGDKVFEERSVLAADSNFFRVFTSHFIEGDAATALQKPNTVVINESTAIKYFGSAANAMGKQFINAQEDGNEQFLVTAVVKDWPHHSHIHFNMLLSTGSFPFIREINYTGFSSHTYLLLHPGSSAASLDSKLPQIIKKYVSGHIERNFGLTFEQFQAAGNGYRYYLQPLKKIHLTSGLEAELSPGGSMTSVYIFSIIAVFILCLACINFINLSTARSMERAREVGIRKTFGSQRIFLIGQFLTESMVTSIISILLTMGLIYVLLPLFNQLSGKSLTIRYFFTAAHISWLILFAIATGLAAGLYPAFILSSFKPVAVLKGRFKSGKYGLVLRNGLVVFQFAISVILIVATMVVNRQMQFMMGEKLGFRKDHVIVIERAGLLQQQTQAFKNELSTIQGVESVSGTTSVPGSPLFFGVTWLKAGSKEGVTGRGINTDEHFAKVLGLELVQGRFFSNQFASDSLAVVLNEKAVADLGLTNPIGARLTTPDGDFNGQQGEQYVYTVIGVVKDFHYQSLHQKINPLFFNYSKRFGNVSPLIPVRIKADNFQAAISGIEGAWKKFIKERPFYYSFLDQSVADQYQAEQTTWKIFSIFSSLAIFIACIGLLGLAAFTTQQRIREIGIRKVLGASVGNIITMLSKDFLKLVVIASAVALPLAWLAIHQWLQNYAYRIDISWWILLGSASLALLVALATISFQAVKAALSNPVKSLRTE